MVEHHLIDIDLDSPECDRTLSAWRCLNCGNIIERGIGLNRTTKPSWTSHAHQERAGASGASDKAVRFGARSGSSHTNGHAIKISPDLNTGRKLSNGR
ncbi:MAG: hypothetical protein C4293_20565 [Nitrospiraceae bacterium]